MNTVDILKAAKQLLVDKGWTQEAFARDTTGDKVRAWAGEARCFCGIGAIRAAVGGIQPGEPACYALADAIGAKDCYEDFFEFNDAPGRTVDEVLAVFDKAIAAEEGRLAPQQ